MCLPGHGLLSASPLRRGSCGTWPLPWLCPLPSVLGPLEGTTAGPARARHTLGFGQGAAPTAAAERQPSAHPSCPLGAHAVLPTSRPAWTPSVHRGLVERAVGKAGSSRPGPRSPCPPTRHLRGKPKCLLPNPHPAGRPGSNRGRPAGSREHPAAPHQQWPPGPPPWHPSCHGPSRPQPLSLAPTTGLQQILNPYHDAGLDSKAISSLAHSLIQECEPPAKPWGSAVSQADKACGLSKLPIQGWAPGKNAGSHNALRPELE